MQNDYAVSIDLKLFHILKRNKFIAAVKKLNLFYLLEDQVLKINENDALALFQATK